jgi:hypothetical protein
VCPAFGNTAPEIPEGAVERAIGITPLAAPASASA